MTESVLLEAERLVTGARQGAYGHPYDDFSKTAKIVSVIVGVEVTPAQVGLIQIAVKMSREINMHKRDNLVDIAGYAKTIELVEERVAGRYTGSPGSGPVR